MEQSVSVLSSDHDTEPGAMHDLNDVQFFVAVAESQGFSAAARNLNLPKSSVSRRIASLEARLGVRLTPKKRGPPREGGEVRLQEELPL